MSDVPDQSSDRAGVPLLVYDGDCAFCTRSIRAIERWARPAVDFAPWQRLDLDQLGLTERQVTTAVRWIGPDGRCAHGAVALALTLGRGAAPWPAVGAAIRTPPLRWLAAAVYRVIAANRQRMPGGSAACALPPRQ